MILGYACAPSGFRSWRFLEANIQYTYYYYLYCVSM